MRVLLQFHLFFNILQNQREIFIAFCFLAFLGAKELKTLQLDNHFLGLGEGGACKFPTRPQNSLRGIKLELTYEIIRFTVVQS